MTEIPEHLLKRSKERRAALGGGEPGAAAVVTPAVEPGSPATASPDSPAVAARPPTPARAVPAAPPPPKPDPAYVIAAKNRKTIPFWAMATLSLLPLWGFMYVQGVKPPAERVGGPLGDGAGVFASCATCHGATGGGGVGRPFLAGQSVKTFPHIEDQLNLVYVGSKAFADANLGPYGDPSVGHAPGSYNGSYMPAQGTGLSEAQILAVVCHERYRLGGVATADPAFAEEFTKWCAEDSEIYAGLEDGSLTFDNLHEEAEAVLPVGTEARPGTPAGGGE
ncbi:MAG: c-type cytochrome [Ilumatobacteraceae bacterium]